ncbi:MAG TPA: ATP-binding protein [Spirochaetota bacterium]|nr:ATP-binding protein [Spirochaetota bacterium]
MNNERYLLGAINADLGKKMVFIGGPRQVGKTYLSKRLLDLNASDQYLNWDSSAHRKIILGKTWDRTKALVVFDELHKYRPWKSWLKGVFDTEERPPAVLVTGSARLNVFRRGGDSMMGRYFYFRLHPFSLRELVEYCDWPPETALAALWERGGFPEPLFSESALDAARWRKSRLETIIREDALTLENVRHLASLELLVDLLRERVGSPISYKALSEDLGVSPQTVKSWIDLLERLYLVFSVTSYHRSLARALKKEIKVYFYDYSDIGDGGARFENLIASHLMKEAHYLEDVQGRRVSLHTLKDKEKREVDFLVAENGRPIELVEAKLGRDSFSAPLMYYARRFPGIAATQVVKDLPESRSRDGVRMVGARDFLTGRGV